MIKGAQYSLAKLFKFVVCNPCQSSPSLTILVPLWFIIVSLIFFYLYIPLTNRVRGPYCKLRTEFFPPRFMAQARSTRAINRRGKNEEP